MEASVYNSLDGAFGTPDCIYCVQPLNRETQAPISNVAFLPKQDEILTCFWDVLRNDTPTDRPHEAEERYLVLTLLATEGEKYTKAQDVKDLVDCFLHSLLGASFFFKSARLGLI